MPTSRRQKQDRLLLHNEISRLVMDLVFVCLCHADGTERVTYREEGEEGQESASKAARVRPPCHPACR